jgi:hypothetical protein
MFFLMINLILRIINHHLFNSKELSLKLLFLFHKFLLLNFIQNRVSLGKNTKIHGFLTCQHACVAHWWLIRVKDTVRSHHMTFFERPYTYFVKIRALIKIWRKSLSSKLLISHVIIIIVLNLLRSNIVGLVIILKLSFRSIHWII